MAEHFYFSRTVIDRAHHLRQDEAWLREQEARESARLIPMWRDQSLIETGEQPRAVMLANAQGAALRESASDIVFLGIDNESSYFAADLSHMEEPGQAPLPERGGFEDLRNLAGDMDRTEAGILAYARALLYWHRNHQFCGKCGAPTKSGKAGHERRCTNTDCARVHFPRTDPAVIMLATQGEGADEVGLFGRNKRFSGRGLRYSTLAGFVEPGESLEDAVAREVQEETGVEVTDVLYQASQPWPFPASLMLGYRARATSSDITIQEDELTDAQWFTKAQVREMAAEGGVLPPSGLSISRWLIDSWLNEGS